MVSGIRDEVTSPTPRMSTEATTVESQRGGRNNTRRRRSRQGRRRMEEIGGVINTERKVSWV
jgi:hypothetical protein